MMLALADGLTYADVSRAVRATRRLHQPKAGSAKASTPPPIDMRLLRRLPWGTLIAGFAVAEKWSSGTGTGQLCLRLYVRRKVAKARLDAAAFIPETIDVRKGKDRFRLPTDVVVMPQDPSAQRQIEASASIGSFTGVTDGTFGLAVKATDGNPFALTCSHVVSPWFRDNPLNDVIESPPDKDGQAGPNQIGTVHSWTKLVPGATHICDAALVAPGAGVQLSNAPLQLPASSPVASFGIGDLAGNPKLHVQAFTRRKAVSGVLKSVQNHFSMRFLGKTFGFRDVVEVAYDENMIEGDSGAVVLQSATRQILGLHFAGIDGTGTGYFIPINAILSVFSKFGLQPL